MLARPPLQLLRSPPPPPSEEGLRLGGGDGHTWYRSRHFLPRSSTWQVPRGQLSISCGIRIPDSVCFWEHTTEWQTTFTGPQVNGLNRPGYCGEQKGASTEK